MALDWKNLPSLSSLRAFELTARSGSFASAARELNVTHAAIAQRVRSLEAHLGISLARRSGRSVVLTEAGTRLARDLTDGFGTIAAGIDGLRADQVAKPVQITTTIFFSQNVILPRLHEFLDLHPEIQVSILPSQDVVDIADQDIDLAVRGSVKEPDWPGLNAVPIVRSDVIAVGAPSMVSDDMPPLQELPWIWTAGEWHEIETLEAFGLDPGELRNADIGVPAYHFALARQGTGLTPTPEILVREDLASGALRKVPVPSPFSVTYYAATPVGPVRPQVRAVLTWLQDSFAAQSG